MTEHIWARVGKQVGDKLSNFRIWQRNPADSNVQTCETCKCYFVKVKK